MPIPSFTYHRWNSVYLGLTVALGIFASAACANETTGNLFADGGIEEWEAVHPNGAPGSWWLHLTQHKGAAFTYDAEKNILMPKIFEQGAGFKGMQMETADVHGGKRALRIRNGIYLRSKPVPLVDGDIFVVRFWAKSTGTVQVAGPKPNHLGFRLEASAEALVDDLFAARVVRPDEIKLAAVPDDLQERVAFAADAGGEIKVDGTLDEPGWNRAVAFSGFRSYGEQTLLAPVQPSFRVLCDRENLYFGIEIPLPDAQQVLEELKKQPLLDGTGQLRPATDTYSGRESVELFLQAPNSSSYRQLAVSLDGYRFDGSGMDSAWNGTWTSAILPGDDRWFLEMKIPAQDFDVGQIAPPEGWRLNLCCNQRRGSSTWAAVGSNYHNPFAFGTLIARNFFQWYADKLKAWTELRQKIAADAGEMSIDFSERLDRTEAFARNLPVITNGQALNGDAVTRVYMQMNFVDVAYREMNVELIHTQFFQKKPTR